MPTNGLGQLIGVPLPDWTPRAAPPRTAMIGSYCRVEPVNAEQHAADLFRSIGNSNADEGRWTYLPYGPFADHEAFVGWLEAMERGADPSMHVIVDANGQAQGMAAFMRIDQANGVIEIGHLNFSASIQRTRVATEAMFLMMRRAFDELGYRRYEWKCDSLNEPSRRAAARFGFVYEGLFRQSVVYKQRNRDTCWYSMTDAEWPARRAAFEAWLKPDNFDDEGRQRSPLARSNPIAVELLERFAEAWNRHDLDALMSMMSDDCVFEASAGPEASGRRSEGREEVRAAYAAVFETYPDARWADSRHVMFGDRGLSEWTFTGTPRDGKRVEVNGCDLLTFRDGRIAVKNSYRKNRPLA